MPSSAACSRMTELSHWPTETPDRRAASRAVYRASGSMPFTCHGADLILPPAFPHGGQGGADPADRGRYPSTGRGGAPAGCPGTDFFRFAVNMRLRNGCIVLVPDTVGTLLWGNAQAAHNALKARRARRHDIGRAPQSAFNLTISRMRHARRFAGGEHRECSAL